MATTDTFNRADETPMAGNWSVVEEQGFYGFDIYSNAARPSYDNAHSVMFYNAVSFSDDQYSIIPAEADVYCGMVVRAATHQCYISAVSISGGVQHYIVDTVRGWLANGWSGYSFTESGGVGKKLRMRAVGDSIYTDWYNGSEWAVIAGPDVDASPYTGGSPGIYGYLLSVAYDWWEGGDLTAPSIPVYPLPSSRPSY